MKTEVIPDSPKDFISPMFSLILLCFLLESVRRKHILPLVY